jgi:uncharacterized membrane protein
VSQDGRPVAPTRTDPVAASLSAVVGGPVGRHARPHRWWTPVRVLLVLGAVVMSLTVLHSQPCLVTHWTSDDARYSKMCYSDVPYLYTGRGLAAGYGPYADTGGRYSAMEYPVVIGYFAWAAAVVTRALGDTPDISGRRTVSADEIYSQPGVTQETTRYFRVTAVLLAPFGLLAAWFLAGAHRRRPWDAMLFAASPALVLAGLINWDLIAVAAVAGAIWAWSRGKPVVSGIFIGLGTATKLYPLFLLGALLVVCLRRGRMRAFATAAMAAVVTWVLVNLPVLLSGFDQWKVFWSYNRSRGPDLGSLWLVWQQAGHSIGSHTVNVGSFLFFAAVCLGVLGLGLRARRTPRIPQLAYLVVAGFLLVNKVYSPQYVLWLLPLVVLARPRWRDVLIWTAGEVFYFGSVWLYLGGWTASATSGAQDHAYWLGILVRIAVEVYIAVLVVRDILQPWRDPVRADGLTDDPAEPTSEPVPV